VEPGDEVRVLTAGGGGYGDPAERPPSELELDLRDGYITPQAAQQQYGHALSGREEN
jgi:N-methylhydantoinase B